MFYAVQPTVFLYYAKTFSWRKKKKFVNNMFTNH